MADHGSQLACKAECGYTDAQIPRKSKARTAGKTRAMGDHWKSLANKLGAPGMDAPVSEPAPAAPTPPPAPAASKPAPRPAAPAPVEMPPPVVHVPEPMPAPPAEVAKGKRKSSWDTLTSFFGISSPEPEPEVSSAAPAETDALAESFTKPPERERGRGRNRDRDRDRDRPARASAPARNNPPASPPAVPPKASALEELFGDAPRQELSWDKPAPRMVDDVSDWDDEPVVDPPTLDDQADTFTPASEAGDDAEREPGRRRRRRRRGGRRDDVRSGDRVESDRPARVSPRDEASGDDDDIEPWEPEIDAVEPADDWAEPASFGESDVDIDADVDPDAPLPQRRSNRRRRRGRGRSERAEGSLPPATEPTSEVREPRPTREPREARAPREVREPREPREGRESARPARPPREARPIEDEMEVEARPERTRREPREGRPARGEGRQRPPREARREPVAAADDLDNQVDSSLAAELEGDDGSGGRHPKIPTWADSLESIISANMENHSRSDHRGGRGRPRGNGGPPPRRS